jgi:hypothetical protein
VVSSAFERLSALAPSEATYSLALVHRGGYGKAQEHFGKLL